MKNKLLCYNFENFLKTTVTNLLNPLALLLLEFYSRHANILNMIKTVDNKCCTTVRDARISFGSDKAGVFTLLPPFVNHR